MVLRLMVIVCREMNLCDSDDIESETHSAKLILGPKRLKWVEHLLGGNSPDMPEPVCICLNSSIHHSILQEHGNIVRF